MNKFTEILQPFFRKKAIIDSTPNVEKDDSCIELTCAHQALYCNDSMPTKELENNSTYTQVPNSIENKQSDDIDSFNTNSYMKYDTLVEELIGIITEFDTLFDKISNDDVVQAIQMCQYRILESLIKTGLTPIDSDIKFNTALHIPVPYTIPSMCSEITEFIRYGLKYKDKILLKAKVRIRENGEVIGNNVTDLSDDNGKN